MTFERQVLIACTFISLPMCKKPGLVVVGGIGNEISYTIEEKALWNSQCSNSKNVSNRGVIKGGISVLKMRMW